MNRRKIIIPYFLVAVQFFCIGLIVFTGPFIAGSIGLQIVEFSGISLGLWAIVSQGPRNFNVTPTPKPGAKFIMKGPYRLIRHPMYFSIIVTLTPLLIDYFTWSRLVYFLILVADLVVKLLYEEVRLKKQFPDYNGYSKNSWRLLPFLF